jgi:aryl-alcohol dehydrogenase-like predicted oxidoreductase
VPAEFPDLFDMAEFVLGSVQLGLAYGAANRTGKPSRAAALALLRQAADSGIRQFDTARAYGDAEDRLGEALSGRPVTTVTKLSPLADLPEGAGAEAAVAAADASLAESLAALRRDSLDCLLLHRCLHMTAYGGAIWRRLLELRQKGTIRRLGVSVQSVGEAGQALACADVQHIQMPFNLMDWRWREAGIPDLMARRSDLTVHVRSVFLQGLLAADDPGIWPLIEGVDAAAIVETLRRLTADLKRESVADLCLGYARGQSFIDGVVIGLETAEQLERNLRLSLKRPLTPDECRHVEGVVPRCPERLLNPALWPKR